MTDTMSPLEAHLHLRQHRAAIASIRKAQLEARRLAAEHVCPGCRRSMTRRNYSTMHAYSCAACGFSRQVMDGK